MERKIEIDYNLVKGFLDKKANNIFDLQIYHDYSTLSYCLEEEFLKFYGLNPDLYDIDDRDLIITYMIDWFDKDFNFVTYKSHIFQFLAEVDGDFDSFVNHINFSFPGFNLTEDWFKTFYDNEKFGDEFFIVFPKREDWIKMFIYTLTFIDI